MIRLVTPLTLVALAAPAFAQVPSDDPIEDEGMMPEVPDEPPVREQPRTTDVPPPPPMQLAPPPPDRPEGSAIGIGLGYDLPADVQVPNRTSVRFRLASGMTIEPFAGAAIDIVSQDAGANSTNLGFEVGADLRFPRQLKGKMDFVMIGGGGIGLSVNNPEGPDNNTSTFFLDLHWGIGIDLWLRPTWCLILSATNPALSVQTQSMENPLGDTSTTTTQVGAIFEPNVIAMLHLFF